jgi:hypothetical protein
MPVTAPQIPAEASVSPLSSIQSYDKVNPLWTQQTQFGQDPTLNAKLHRLIGSLWADQPRLQWYDAYYEGEQPIQYMSEAMAKEVAGLINPVILNWCRLGADAYASRLHVDGFRYAGSENTDARLWDVFQANGLDKVMGSAFLEAIALSRSYVIVGAGDKPGDPPVVTVESPFQVFAVRDPRTRKVTEAVKLWWDLFRVPWVTFYEKNRTTTFRSDGGQWIPASPGVDDEGDPIPAVDVHNLGAVPVVPLVNRGRILRPNGISEFHDAIPIVDAAIKAATDMMIAEEYHAMPRRWVFGLKKNDFQDQNGNPVSMWSRIAGRIWASEAPASEVSVGQFDESSLSNFHDTIKLQAKLAAQVMALPVEYLSFDTVNPPSAESLGVLNAQLDMRVKSKQVDFGEDLEDVMRLVLRFMDGEWDPQAESIETMWADPSMLTLAQRADAISKLVAMKDGAGRSVLNVYQAREDLGYTAIQRDRMAAQDEIDKQDAVEEAAELAATTAQAAVGAAATVMAPDMKPPAVEPAAAEPAA